jgi:polysaccharide export outer membrane protein
VTNLSGQGAAQRALAIVFMLGAALSAGAQDPPTQTSATPATPAVVTAPDAEDADYLVAPGDVLKLAVWKEPDLTGEVFVRLDGRITVPLVGDIKAAGKTTEQLSAEIRTKLRAFLEMPIVTLTVSQAISARFYVIGEVAASGALPLTGRITVLQGLALAGGFKEFAKKDRIVILRESKGERRAIPFNFKDIELGLNLEQNIVLESGDSIIVP